MTTELTGELSDVLRERRSVRIFDPEHEIADQVLGRLLRAAQWAPSAGNSQPWSFLLARRGDETHDRFVAHLSAGNRPWVPAASLVLITAHQVASGPEEDAPAYSDYAMYDLGQAVALLTVEAGLLGLTAHQFAGFDHQSVTEEFGVPAHWQITTAIAIGVHGDPTTAAPALVERDQQPRTRKPFSEFVYAGKWGAAAEV